MPTQCEVFHIEGGISHPKLNFLPPRGLLTPIYHTLDPFPTLTASAPTSS